MCRKICDLCNHAMSRNQMGVWNGKKVVGWVCSDCGVDMAPVVFWVRRLGDDFRSLLGDHDDRLVPLEDVFHIVTNYRGRVERCPQLSTMAILRKVETFLSEKSSAFVLRLDGRDKGWPDFYLDNGNGDDIWIFCRPAKDQRCEMERMRSIGLRVINMRSMRSFRRILEFGE